MKLTTSCGYETLADTMLLLERHVFNRRSNWNNLVCREMSTVMIMIIMVMVFDEMMQVKTTAYADAGELVVLSIREVLHT